MNTGINVELPLRGRKISLDSRGSSAQYCAGLLRSLGADAQASGTFTAVDAARDWAGSGLVTLTGYPNSPMQGPAAIPSTARGALDALKFLAKRGSLHDLNGAELLSERAAFMQLARLGQTSANGSCRLMQASNGWIALNLARDDDWDSMPAWLEVPLETCTWKTVADQVALQPVSLLLERGRMMGLPVAPAIKPTNRSDSWFSISAHAPGKRSHRPRPLVVDLSSLWAGPLCTRLLLQAGARVIKVESEKRPDGARRGNANFFDLLNAGKESVVLDLSSGKGRAQLRSLLAKADIVVEGSRPRALKQLGIDAQELLKTAPGLTWVSITGYGRAEPQGLWVAFGDDAAAAAGVAMATAVPPLFCGDALADPLTGMHAALAALAFWQGGGGVLLDLSLHNVTAHCLNYHPGIARGLVVKKKGGWQLELDDQSFAVKPPQVRHSISRAVGLGSDTTQVLTEFHIPC
jgi:hypothetical protein